MLYYLFTYQSLTLSKKASRLLEKSGIASFVERTPGKLSANGCAYCVKVSQANARLAAAKLNAADFRYKRSYVLSPDGSFREASL